MTPDLPTSLPAVLYLLAYNLEKDRMFPNRNLGRALRAAALAELHAMGRITDDCGLVRLVPTSTDHDGQGPRTDVRPAAIAVAGGDTGADAGLGGGPGAGREADRAGDADMSGALASPVPPWPTDPVLSAVLGGLMAEPRPRSWADWVDAEHRTAVTDTRDDLEAAGWIRVARGQVVGVIPVRAVVLLRRREIREVNRAAGRVLRGEVELQPGASPDLVRLLALAASGGVITLVSSGERRAYAPRLEKFAEQTGPAVAALARRRLRGGITFQPSLAPFR